MRVVRKMVSTILFLLILCSTFTALPISVGAVETSTPAYVSYQAKRYSDSFQQIFGDGYNSYANTYYRTMKSNEKVVSGIAIWEAAHIATSPTYSVESGLITKEDMYKTAIFDMLDVTESNSFASNLFNILQDSRMSYMFSVAKTVCDEKDIKVEELKNFEVNAEYINFLKDAAKLSKALNVVDKISKVVSGCSNLYDAVCTMASYQAISDMKDGTKEILTAIANDSENPADLRSAARGCVSAFDDGYGSILSAMENASNPYVQATIKTIMDEAIDTIWDEVISGIPGGKVVFGTVKGMRVLSNEIFKMDDTCRVYYQFEADVTLENAIRKCMNNAKYDYMQDKNQSNAVTYMRAVDMYKRIVLQGYDYSMDMLTVKANAPSTKWFDWFNHSYSDCMEMIDKIEQSKNDRKNLYEQFEDWVHSDYINLYCDNYEDTMNKLNNQKPIYATSVTLTQIKDINIGDSGYIYDYIKKTCVPENSVENKKKYFVADNKDIITLDRYGCFTAESSGQVTLTYDKGGDLESSITINIGSTKTDNTYDYTKEFQYETNYNEENHRDEVTITKYIGTRSNVIIPYSIDGNVVTKIGDFAFKYCTSLVSVKIPNGVVSIGKWSFLTCTSLVYITIPDSITYILEGAFANCSSLASVILPNSITKIEDAVFVNCSGLININIPDSITSIEYLTFSGCTSLTSVTIPDGITRIEYSAFSECTSLTSITIPDSVEYIGDSAFSKCTSLTSITIPNSVTDIKYLAFYGCESLKSITIPNSVTSIEYCTFGDCTSLTNITIPNSVISIGNDTFRNCTSLTNITIPNSVTSIGNGAFRNCTSLTDITIPNSVTSIEDYVFYRCISLTSITIPNSVTSIEYCTFGDCTSLTSITIPDSVISIDGAFEGCTSLISIAIPDSVTSIGGYTFKDCTSLKNIIIPNRVTSIGDNTFEGCISLENIIIPNGVTSIGDNTFEGCISLENIIIPNSVTSIGDYIFKGCANLINVSISNNIENISQYAFEDCTSLRNITIPTSVTSIRNSAFIGCTSLVNVTIPNSVTDIKYKAFYGCKSLKSITIPNSVTSIEYSTFEGCTSLTSITIPDSVTSIGGAVFSGCTSLASITIPDSVKDINQWTFQGCKNLKNVILGNGIVSLGDYVFAGCTSLENIKIPNNITSIGMWTFYDCINLKSVIIGNGVKKIVSNAFDYCYNVKNILYTGSKDEWSSIETDINLLRNAQRHYNSKFIKTVYPTCVEKGYDVYTCSECKDGVKINFVDPLGHSFVNGVCERCGGNKSDLLESSHPYKNSTDETYKIQKDGAKSITVVFSESTETESGHDYIKIFDKDNNMVGQYSGTELSGKKIVVQGDTVVIQLISDGSNNYYGFSVKDVIPCNHKTTEIRNSKAETCISDGYTGDLVCTECELVLKKGEVIPATGKHDFEDTVYNANCVDKGYTVHSCKNCDYSYTDSYVDPLGHSFVNGVCERCGNFVESLHPYEDYTDETYTIHKDGAKRIAVVFSESTETEYNYDYISIYDKDDNMVGQYSGTELSGKRIVVQGDTVIIKLTSDESNNYYGFSVTDVIPYYDECNHKTSEIRNSKVETCGDDGYTGDLVCTECELVLKKGEVIPATGKHDFEDTVYNATCVDEGYTVHSCKNCDYSYTDSYVDATGEHKYKDGICETCGRPDIDNLENINGSDTKNIEIENEGDCKYFKFTPEKDGTLKIYSTGTYDTYGYLYDSNMGLLSSNDDGEDSNFSITYDVTAGKTYVIGCKMYSSSIGSFDLVVNFEPNNTYKIGDANGDEKVTVADITVIQKYLANRLQLSDERLIACDVNKDGVVTIEDATLIQKYLIHLVPSLN